MVGLSLSLTMEVKEVYPAIVEQWKHDGFERSWAITLVI